MAEWRRDSFGHKAVVNTRVLQPHVGQAVGVLIDATIMRALLVPALMRPFGEWNWWAPAPLRRIQRRYRFQETKP